VKSAFDKEKFTLYHYQSEIKMLVAVAAEHRPKLKHALKEFGSFKEVPLDWEIGGILIESTKSKTVNFDEDSMQSEIAINCLAEYNQA
jgi:hypothetical protein